VPWAVTLNSFWYLREALGASELTFFELPSIIDREQNDTMLLKHAFIACSQQGEQPQPAQCNGNAAHTMLLGGGHYHKFSRKSEPLLLEVTFSEAFW
jgi:hypothetical protein